MGEVRYGTPTTQQVGALSTLAKAIVKVDMSLQQRLAKLEQTQAGDEGTRIGGSPPFSA